MSGTAVKSSVGNKTESPYEIDFNNIVINGQNYGELYSFGTIAPSSNRMLKMEIPRLSNNEEVHQLGTEENLIVSKNFRLFNRSSLTM